LSDAMVALVGLGLEVREEAAGLEFEDFFRAESRRLGTALYLVAGDAVEAEGPRAGSDGPRIRTVGPRSRDGVTGRLRVPHPHV